MNPEELFLAATRAADTAEHVRALSEDSLRELYGYCEDNNIQSDVWSDCLIEIGRRFLEGRKF